MIKKHSNRAKHLLSKNSLFSSNHQQHVVSEPISSVISTDMELSSQHNHHHLYLAATTKHTITTATTMGSTTTTTATTTTTTAFVPQSCTSGSPTMLLSLLNPSAFSYTEYSYSYTPTTAQVTIMIQFEQDPSSFSIDDVSVVNPSSPQLLSNGGFETGSLAPWQHGTVVSGNVASGCGHSGSYCYNDAIVGQTDNIHQTFSTVPGNTLNVSFYLQNNSGGSVIIARACIYPPRTSFTTVNRRIWPYYMAPYYDRKSPCRNTVKYVKRRISPHTARRFTIVIRSHVIRPNTAIYRRIRPCMFDLGILKQFPSNLT
ncbi:unnamed protein product [Rotaria socialis]|uniref:Uncharacterized protein n=1 Tax=Rotaria socialis TaxID=392032 RepID=A0A817QL16_9BILA|nr:unnamed protein product [Rotaria socialis]